MKLSREEMWDIQTLESQLPLNNGWNKGKEQMMQGDRVISKKRKRNNRQRVKNELQRKANRKEELRKRSLQRRLRGSN